MCCSSSARPAVSSVQRGVALLLGYVGACCEGDVLAWLERGTVGGSCEGQTGEGAEVQEGVVVWAAAGDDELGGDAPDLVEVEGGVEGAGVGRDAACGAEDGVVAGFDWEDAGCHC